MSQINIQNLIRPEPIKPVERGEVKPEYIQGGLQGGQIQLGEAPRLPSKSSEQVQYENLAAIAGSFGQSLNIFGDIAQKIDKRTIQEVEAEFAKLDAEELVDPREQYKKFNEIVKGSTTFISGNTWKDTILSQAQKRFGKEALNKFAIEKYQEDALAYNNKYSGKLDDETFNQEFLPKWIAENPSLEQVPSIRLMQNGLILANEARQQDLFLNTIITSYQDTYQIPPQVLKDIGSGLITVEEAEAQNLITPEAKTFYLEAQKSDSLIDLQASLNATLYASLVENPSFARLSEPQVRQIVIGASKSLQPTIQAMWNLAKETEFFRTQQQKKVSFSSKLQIIQQNPQEATTESFRELSALSSGLPVERMQLVSFIGTSLWSKTVETTKGTDAEENPYKQRKIWEKEINSVLKELNITPKDFGLDLPETLLKLVESTATIGDGQNQISLAQFFQKQSSFALQQLGSDAVSEIENQNATNPRPFFDGVMRELFWTIGGTTYNTGIPEPKYGYRTDGKTPKGTGYFGPLTITDSNGQTQDVTEYSVTLTFSGIGDVEIPSLVPTLTGDEINQVLEAAKTGAQPPTNVIAKAAKYAQMRMKEGLSPFANSEPLPEVFVEVDTAVADFNQLILEDTDSKTTRERLERLRYRLKEEGNLEEFEKYISQNGFGVKLDMDFIRSVRDIKNKIWKKTEENLTALQRGESSSKSEKGRFAVIRTQNEFVSDPEKFIGTIRAYKKGNLDPNDPDDSVTITTLNLMEQGYKRMLRVSATEAVLQDKAKISQQLGTTEEGLLVIAEASYLPENEQIEFIVDKLGVDRESAFGYIQEYNNIWYRRFMGMNDGLRPDDVSYSSRFVSTDGFNPQTVFKQIEKAYTDGQTGEVNSILSALEYHLKLAFSSGVSVSNPQIANFKQVFGSWLNTESLSQLFIQSPASPEARAQSALSIALLRATTRTKDAIRFWGDDKQIDSQYMTIVGHVLNMNPTSYDPQFLQGELRSSLTALTAAARTTANQTIASIPERVGTLIYGPSSNRLPRNATYGDVAQAAVSVIGTDAAWLFPYLLSGDKKVFTPDAAGNVYNETGNLSLIHRFLESGSGVADPLDPKKELSVGEFFRIPLIQANRTYNGFSGVNAQIKAIQDSLGLPGFEMLIRGLVAFNYPADKSSTGTIKEVESGRSLIIKTLAQTGFQQNTGRTLSTEFLPDGRILFRGDDDSNRLPNHPNNLPTFIDHFDSISFVGQHGASPTGIPFLLDLPPDETLQAEPVGRGITFKREEIFSGTEMRVFSPEIYTPKTAAEMDEQFKLEHQAFLGVNVDWAEDIPEHLQPPIAKKVTPEQSFYMGVLSLPINYKTIRYLSQIMPEISELREISTIETSIARGQKPEGKSSLIELFLKETKNNPEDESLFDFLRWYDKKVKDKQLPSVVSQQSTQGLQFDILNYAFNPNIRVSISVDGTSRNHILQHRRINTTTGVTVPIPERNVDLSNITPITLSQVRKEARRQNPQNKTNIQQRAMYQRVYLQAMRYQYIALKQQASEN